MFAVIGAHYGDEGKGLITDYLSNSDTLVVRFNGGAQAGHTVVTPEGIRHEFHHFGAGTFRGARTLLSRHFIVNPMIFRKEWGQLGDAAPQRKIFCDYRARVTTPFDVLINQALARVNGHGSCGVGINETVTRSERYPLLASGPFEARCRIIARDWVPERLQQLGLQFDRWDFEWLVERYLEDVEFFLSRVTLVMDTEMLVDDNIVFEGAQGLLLDEVDGQFPHVTRSRTGLTNVMELLAEAKHTEPLQIYYVTRTYITRHGNGPLSNEVAEHPFGWTGPETNVTNEFQGSLRYAPLNMRELLERFPASQIAVTCADQLGVSDPHRIISEMFGEDQPALISFGPTRDSVVECLARSRR